MGVQRPHQATAAQPQDQCRGGGLPGDRHQHGFDVVMNWHLRRADAHFALFADTVKTQGAVTLVIGDDNFAAVIQLPCNHLTARGEIQAI